MRSGSSPSDSEAPAACAVRQLPSSTWCVDASLQLRVIALDQPPHRHLLGSRSSCQRASGVCGQQRLTMRIALLPTTGTSFPVSALQMLRPAHRFQELPVPGHLARLAARPNRLEAQQLAEVAGERRVEAKLSHKLAESPSVRYHVDLELRRHQTLHGAAELASDRCRSRAKFPSRTSLVLTVSSKDFGGVRSFFSKKRPCCLKLDLTLEPLVPTMCNFY